MNGAKRAEEIAAEIDEAFGLDEKGQQWAAGVRQLGRDYAAGRLRADDIEVRICAAIQDEGPETLEALALIPVLPREGDRLEVLMPSGTEYLHVKFVCLPTFTGPGARIEVWVQLPDCFDRAVLEEAFQALRDGYGNE